MQAKNRWTVEKNSTSVEAVAMADPIPVRFRDEADTKLSGVALRARMSKAELIRIAVDEFLDKVEASGEIVQRVILDAPIAEPLPPKRKVNYVQGSKPAAPSPEASEQHKDLRREKLNRPEK